MVWSHGFLIKDTIYIPHINWSIQPFHLKIVLLCKLWTHHQPVTLLSSNASTAIPSSSSFCFNPILTITSLNNFSFFSLLRIPICITLFVRTSNLLLEGQCSGPQLLHFCSPQYSSHSYNYGLYAQKLHKQNFSISLFSAILISSIFSYLSLILFFSFTFSLTTLFFSSNFSYFLSLSPSPLSFFYPLSSFFFFLQLFQLIDLFLHFLYHFHLFYCLLHQPFHYPIHIIFLLYTSSSNSFLLKSFSSTISNFSHLLISYLSSL